MTVLQSARPITLSWSEVRDYYAGLSAEHSVFSGLFRMIDPIAASWWSSGLFPWISVHTLCIAQAEVCHPYEGPRLEVSTVENGALSFRYLQHAGVPDPWHAVVHAHQGFDTFCRFLDEMRWTTVQTSASSVP